jgi:hypothetical protein
MKAEGRAASLHLNYLHAFEPNSVGATPLTPAVVVAPQEVNLANFEFLDSGGFKTFDYFLKVIHAEGEVLHRQKIARSSRDLRQKEANRGRFYDDSRWVTFARRELEIE